jgi:putative redox protein
MVLNNHIKYSDMTTIQTIYKGQLRTEATHLQSGVGILTDAPTDNHGRGEAFSPTDLLAGSLGSCMITIMGIVANRDGIDLEGTKIDITKVMTTELPRKVAKIVVVFKMKTAQPLDEITQKKLERAAHTCPVALSLHPDIVQEVTFVW